jgi:hypothetical protein
VNHDAVEPWRDMVASDEDVDMCRWMSCQPALSKRRTPPDPATSGVEEGTPEKLLLIEPAVVTRDDLRCDQLPPSRCDLVGDMVRVDAERP